jgi:CRP-like cAMP-binding protein
MKPHELKLWFLKHHDLFHSLPDEALQELDRRSVMKEYPPRSYIRLSGESDMIYLIKDGHLEVGTLDPEGKELILELLGPHDFFGVLTHHPTHVPFLRTVGVTKVCILHRRDFLDLIRRYPDVALKVFERQTLRIQELERRLEALAHQNTRRRVARLLLTLSEKFGEEGIPLTHQEVASMAGCARETASSLLSSFHKAGWIETGKGRIRVLAVRPLQEIAGGHA